MQTELFATGHRAAEQSAQRADRAEPDWTECVEVRDRYVAERAIHGRFALRRDSDGSENFSLSDYEVRIVKRLFAEIRRQA